MRDVASVLRRYVAGGVTVVTLGFAGPASAAPTLEDKAAAEALFEEALKLMEAKHFDEACPKLDASERLDPAVGTRYRLAECEEAIGKLASAWAGFIEVADLSHEAGQMDRENVARARAAAIEPKLSRVSVEVTEPNTPGLKLSNGKTPVRRGQWGTPVPVDPGPYTLVATAPGRKPWTGSVQVTGEGSTSKLLVPTLELAPVAEGDASPTTVPAAPPGSEAPVSASPEQGGRWRTATIAGVGLIGAGSAGVVASLVMGLVAKGRYDGAACGAATCTAPGETSIDGARQLGDAATVVFIASAAVAAAGVVVVVATPSRTASSRGAELIVGPGQCFIRGSF
jgi:serine/threonine-protein kinase